MEGVLSRTSLLRPSRIPASDPTATASCYYISRIFLTSFGGSPTLFRAAKSSTLMSRSTPSRGRSDVTGGRVAAEMCARTARAARSVVLVGAPVLHIKICASRFAGQRRKILGWANMRDTPCDTRRRGSNTCKTDSVRSPCLSIGTMSLRCEPPVAHKRPTRQKQAKTKD